MLRYSSWLAGTRSGNWNWLNQLTGKLRAEDMSQPLNGSEKIRPYNRTCDSAASRRSQDLVSPSREGTGFSSRHTNRMIANMKMVMPNDLCKPMACSLAAIPSDSARSMMIHWLMMSSTMSQCSVLETTPQDRTVLRKFIPVSYRRQRVGYKPRKREAFAP